MAFDYEKETKNHYKDDYVVEKYHQAFARSKGWKTIRFRIIANRERAVVSRFLRQVPHQKVLDLLQELGNWHRCLKALVPPLTPVIFQRIC